MARFGLWVAALSLVCLIAVVTSDDAPQINSDAEICAQFMNEGSTMIISRVFDMLFINFRDYIPEFGFQKLRGFMEYADSDKDDRLNQSECVNLIEYIKHKFQSQQKN